MAEKRRYRKLEIIPVCGGWVVIVGCRQLVYMDTDEGRNKMKADFEEYLLRPDETERRILQENIDVSAVAPVAAEDYRVENIIRGAGGSSARGLRPDNQALAEQLGQVRTRPEPERRDCGGDF